MLSKSSSVVGEEVVRPCLTLSHPARTTRFISLLIPVVVETPCCCFVVAAAAGCVDWEGLPWLLKFTAGAVGNGCACRWAGCGLCCVSSCLQALQAESSVSPVVRDSEGHELRLEAGDFVTGLVGLNRIASRICDLPDEEKRKILFGSDQLVP